MALQVARILPMIYLLSKYNLATSIFNCTKRGAIFVLADFLEKNDIRLLKSVKFHEAIMKIEYYLKLLWRMSQNSRS